MALKKFRRVETVENYDFRHLKMTEKIEKTYLALHNGISSSILDQIVRQGHFLVYLQTALVLFYTEAIFQILYSLQH